MKPVSGTDVVEDSKEMKKVHCKNRSNQFGLGFQLFSETHWGSESKINSPQIPQGQCSLQVKTLAVNTRVQDAPTHKMHPLFLLENWNKI